VTEAGIYPPGSASIKPRFRAQSSRGMSHSVVELYVGVATIATTLEDRKTIAGDHMIPPRIRRQTAPKTLE
jgi:hypothetical protein